MNKNIKKIQSEVVQISTKKIFMMFCIAIFLTSFVSAELFVSKTYTEPTALSKYGKIKINNFFTGKVKEVDLTFNTDYCLTNCYAEGTTTIYSTGKLFDSVDFRTSKNSIKYFERDYKILLGTEAVRTVTTPTYTESCSLSKSGNYSCSQVQTGTKEVYETYIDYNKEYKFEDLKPNKYYWRLEGTKGSQENLDWVPVFNGIKGTEWAEWNSSYDAFLVDYFSMNDETGTNVTSIFNPTRSGTSTGFWTSGKKLGATYINTTSWVNFTSSKTIGNFTYNNPFTLHFWFNATATDNDGNIIGRFVPNGNTGWSLSSSAGKIMIYWLNGAWPQGLCRYTNYSIASNYGNYVMVDLVYDGTSKQDGIRIYINGSEVTTTNCEGFSFTLNASSTVNGNMKIGEKDLNDGTSNYNAGFDELAIFNTNFSQLQLAELFDSGIGIFYEETLAPIISVSLITPTNNTLSTSSNQTFNSTYTYSNMNITNATYYVWYENSSLFNQTTLEVSSLLNYTNLTIGEFTLGSYNWNVYACGENLTDTICSWGANGNYSIDFAGYLLSEIYSNITYETANENFLANFSLFPGSNVISVNLIYNGTSYVVSDITNYGTFVELKRTIDIPLVANTFQNETKQYLWSFVFSNGGLIPYNTTLRNQTILPINLIYCNNTYRTVSLNFTTYNELNPNPIINATFHTAWDYWYGSGSIKKTYAFEDTSAGNSSFKFCIDPNQTTIKATLNAEITSTGFYPRTYYLFNATLNNITQEVPIRMINESSGVKFFHTIRESVTRVGGANVIISKYDVGLGMWVTVGIRQSDDEGRFIEYLELDKSYSYAITKDGDFLGYINKTAICESAPCLMDLEISDTATNFWTGYYDVYAPNVIYNLSYSPTTKLVTYQFVDISGLANYFRLQVNLLSSNQTGELICNNTLFSTVGSLTCNMTGETGSFVAKGFVSRSPEKNAGVLYGILDAIADIIGKDDGLLFTFILVIVVGLIGAWNPAVGVILAGLAFIFASMIGLVIVSFTAIVLLIILIIILVVKMGRSGV